MVLKLNFRYLNLNKLKNEFKSALFKKRWKFYEN